jgi:hypothetical protein
MEFDCLEEDAEGRGFEWHAVDDLYCFIIKSLDVDIDARRFLSPLGPCLTFTCLLKRPQHPLILDLLPDRNLHSLHLPLLLLLQTWQFNQQHPLQLLRLPSQLPPYIMKRYPVEQVILAVKSIVPLYCGCYHAGLSDLIVSLLYAWEVYVRDGVEDLYAGADQPEQGFSEDGGDFAHLGFEEAGPLLEVV